jgi:hypothetical protein
MEEWLVLEVWRRAGQVCEYCHMPQVYYPTVFEIDHVIAKQHGGLAVLSNLALACLRCNGHKGPNIAGLDPRTNKLTKLFNPRQHKWDRHFRWDGAFLVGKTPIGRTTVSVLAINGPSLLGLREALIEDGLFP